jgi:hypothetical protein
VLVVIGVTAAVTISVVNKGNGDGDGGPTPTGDTFGLASAGDKGPANIITEDPSCAAWRPINETFANITKKGWNKRDPAIPASDWTPQQRAPYEEMGQAARVAADQTVPLAKLTPHRVMRELFEQFIAYARAYSDAIPTYTPRDDHISGTVITVGGALTWICTAIEYQSAQARAPLVGTPEPPKSIAPLSDPNNPQRFITEPDATCPDWNRLLDDLQANTSAQAWESLDATIAASAWTPEQRAVIDAVTPVMTQLAEDLDRIGRDSSNPLIQDFALLSAQYRFAYVKALPTYTAADSYLATVSIRLLSTLYEACEAVGG